MREEDRPGAFYGRRRGKALRALQEQRLDTLLPALSLDATAATIDPALAFDGKPDGVVLEIGFGGGEHLAAEARAHPASGFIGCEPFRNGMAKLLGLVAEAGLANVRVWGEDAGDLLERLRPASIDIVYLLYPDPWPKRRQRKRRFVSVERLDLIVRVLKPGGEFRFATDIDDYAGWTLTRALDHPGLVWTAGERDHWRRPWASWQSTRYEAKALAAGRPPTYLTFKRV